MRAFWNYPTTNQPDASPRKILRGAQKVLISYGVDRECQDPIFKRICNIPKQQIQVTIFQEVRLKWRIYSRSCWQAEPESGCILLLRIPPNRPFPSAALIESSTLL